MVPENLHIHSKDIQHLLFYLAAVEIEIQGALDGIARIHEQYILFCRANTVDHRFAPHHSAESVGPRHYSGMSVIGVEDNQFFALSAVADTGSERKGSENEWNYKKSFHYIFHVYYAKLMIFPLCSKEKNTDFTPLHIFLPAHGMLRLP